MWKCFACKLVLDDIDLIDRKCPVCLSDLSLKPMCERDHVNCTHERVAGVAFCSVCGEPVCPTCNSHDVFQISRITGYYQDVAGWNIAKRQELKDRAHYNL